MPHDDQNELFYWVDESDHILGRITRKEAHSGSMKLHRSIVVVFFDSERIHVLFQKRSRHKDTAAGYWAISVGGHVTAGETYRQAVKKEVFEELGVDAATRFSHKTISTNSVEHEMVGVYTGTLSNTPETYDQIEIDELRWIAVDNLDEFVNKQNVTPLSKQILTELGLLNA